MAPSRPSRARGPRGTLSDDQWQDIRHAAPIASREGVTILIHGVKIFGGNPARAGNRQQARSDAVVEPSGARRMDTDAAPTGAEKKQQRDALRAKAHRASASRAGDLS